MNQAIIVLAVLTVILGIAGLTWYFNADARVKRALRALPVRPISSLVPGEIARVTGYIKPGQSMRAPLSGREGVHYRVLVEEHQKSGKSRRWVEIIRDERSVDFSLADGSGEVQISMRDAQVAVVHDSRSKSGTFDDANGSESQFLARHGRSSTGLLGLANRSLRYKEGVLEIGEQVTVCGRVARRRDGLALEAPPGGCVYVSDGETALG